MAGHRDLNAIVIGVWHTCEQSGGSQAAHTHSGQCNRHGVLARCASAPQPEGEQCLTDVQCAATATHVHASRAAQRGSSVAHPPPTHTCVNCQWRHGRAVHQQHGSALLHRLPLQCQDLNRVKGLHLSQQQQQQIHQMLRTLTVHSNAQSPPKLTALPTEAATHALHFNT